MKTRPLCPADKTIGTAMTPLVLSVCENGWPRWTHIDIGDTRAALTEEELHDLHYATGRALSFLKRARKYDEHFHDV